MPENAPLAFRFVLRVVERQMDIYLETCDTSCWEGSNSPLGRFKTRVLVPSAVYLLLLHEKNRCKQGTSQKKRFPVHVRTLKQRIFFCFFWKIFTLEEFSQKLWFCGPKESVCMWTKGQTLLVKNTHLRVDKASVLCHSNTARCRLSSCK